MPRPKNPQKCKTPNTLNPPLLHPVNTVRNQLLSPEFLSSIECDCVSDIVVSNPVTDPVSVAGPEEHL